MTDTPDEAARIALAIVREHIDWQRNGAPKPTDGFPPEYFGDELTEAIASAIRSRARAAAEEMRRQAANHYMLYGLDTIIDAILALPLPDAPAVPARAPDGLPLPDSELEAMCQASIKDEWLVPSDTRRLIMEIRRLRTLPARASDGWRPISEAPNASSSQERILVCGGRYKEVELAFADGEFWRREKVGPTMWMPLPAPPQPEPRKEGTDA